MLITRVRLLRLLVCMKSTPPAALLSAQVEGKNLELGFSATEIMHTSADKIRQFTCGDRAHIQAIYSKPQIEC